MAIETDTLKLITVFIAGAFGAIIGPFIKSIFDKRGVKKSAKMENRPEVSSSNKLKAPSQ